MRLVSDQLEILKDEVLLLFVNQAGLREQLALLRRKELDWLERMDVVVSPSASGSGTVEGKEGEETVDPDDDFGREMHL